MRRRLMAAASLFALSLCACSGDSQWTGTVTDSAGVTIVENTQTSIWSIEDQWTLEEDLRIGAVEGDPDYQFGSIGLIAVDSRDRIYVVDMQARHIKVFSSEGRFERIIGRPGEGPGELGAAVGAIFVGPGDTLLVPDLMNRRVNRYSPDGESTGSFPLDPTQGIPMAINATRSGVIAEQVRPFPSEDLPEADSMDVILTLSTDGTVLDTLKTIRSGRSIRGRGEAAEQVLFAAEPVWQLDDDMTLFYGVNDEYRIGVYSPEGQLERVITKPFELVPITESDQQMMMTFFEELVRENVPPQAQAEAMARLRSQLHFAEHYPAFAAIQVGPGGTMWVQHIQSPSGLSEEELASWDIRQDLGARDWDVFDPDGRFLGVVTMPARFAVRKIHDNEVYGVWRDEFDVQYAMRLRIVGIDLDDTGAIQLGAMP